MAWRRGQPVVGRRRTPGGVPVGDDGRGGAELGLGLASAGPAQWAEKEIFFKHFFAGSEIQNKIIL